MKGVRKMIIDNVSVTFPRGKSIGLLGRNGAGKSTLLQIIAGTLELDRGRIIRQGKISWPLGFQGSFQGNLSGEQNVRFVARIYGVNTDELVAYVAEFAELGQFYHAPVRTYSSGMKARLAFGVSMGINFDYYLVDEITAVGDTNFKRKSQQTFKEKLSNSDVIMVSHSTGTLRDYCQTGIVLENGQMTYYDDINEAIAVHESNMKRH
ncbi:capsular polysaccharide transport system ATP-binding protein [Rhizobium cellulosilyticum]|uniref:Capsular polysaccharide transport system ATP-binding protein n=2 Tax=Pseudomonadota TaxID=1224 RepID=A0A7W6Y3P2_9HYPH|nr:capsular polysaccharide transport system ATP-binding protein [Rhizobium cellulosilyticum]MBB4411594.1 capsular polysaccharide transport system ATP-binding protein [Rhizobium cellulosilyticum]MBB4446285.1 capsular polysaccharide transport system ATP-binding protein [Rhizobium cellulosilyticum]